MSSDESGEEEIANGEKRQVLKIKPLRWRAAKVDCFFKQLDHKASKLKSRQSKQQTLPRVAGSWSTRPKPVNFDKDFFGLTASEPHFANVPEVNTSLYKFICKRPSSSASTRD